MIKEYIRTVPDYPVEGVNFYDMNSLFASPIWPYAVKSLSNHVAENYHHITHVVGIESRGFVVGAAIAEHLGVPFVMVRKEGSKYPGDLLTAWYDTEYSTDSLTLQTGLLGHTSRVIIADDLVATGGSMMATRDLVLMAGGKVLAGVAPINLTYLNKHLTIDIISLEEIEE
jgi:adenine phosphoribosyltransferase